MICSSTHMLKPLVLPGQIQGSCAHIDIQVMFGKRATMFFQIVPGILIQVRILVETEHSINLYFIIKISSGFRYCSQCCPIHLPVVPHCSSRMCLPWLFDSICDWLQQPGVLCQIHSSCSLHWLLCEKCAHWGGVQLSTKTYKNLLPYPSSHLSSSLKSQNFLSDGPSRVAWFSFSITQDAVRVRGS